jgi:hypothetical protein
LFAFIGFYLAFIQLFSSFDHNLPCIQNTSKLYIDAQQAQPDAVNGQRVRLAARRPIRG